MAVKDPTAFVRGFDGRAIWRRRRRWLMAVFIGLLVEMVVLVAVLPGRMVGLAAVAHIPATIAMVIASRILSRCPQCGLTEKYGLSTCQNCGAVFFDRET